MKMVKCQSQSHKNSYPFNTHLNAHTNTCHTAKNFRNRKVSGTFSNKTCHKHLCRHSSCPKPTSEMFEAVNSHKKMCVGVEMLI